MSSTTPKHGLTKQAGTDNVSIDALDANFDKLDDAVLDSDALTGDLSGTLAAPVVAKVAGVAVTGTPTTGQVPTATGAAAATWQTPASGNPTLGGDLSGTASAAVVGKVNGVTVTGTPSNGQQLIATGAAAASWSNAGSGPPSGAAGGDLSGTFPNPTVAKIAGVAVSGTPSSGQVPVASDATHAAWGAQVAATVADQRVVGNISGGTAAPIGLTAAQVKTLLAIGVADVTGFDTQVRTSRLDQMAAPTADVALNTHKLTGVVDPTNPQEAATKAYVDAHAGGSTVPTSAKASCACATTANITLSGEQTIDAVVTLASRVLVKNQTTASQNGIYVSAAGGWSRATDADADVEVTNGIYTFITAGTANGSSGWILVTPDPIVVGTTALTFSKFTSLVTPISIANGGTGSTTAVAGLAALGGVALSGSTMTGALDMGSHKITSLTDPVGAQDAASKHYVDAQVGGAAWGAVPVWIANTDTSAFYAVHAGYVMTGTPATDGAVVRAFLAQGPVCMLPSATPYTFDTTTVGGRSIHSSLFVYPNFPLVALIPGTVTVRMAAGTVNQGNGGLGPECCVLANLSANGGGQYAAHDSGIIVDGIIFDGNGGNQGAAGALGAYDVWDCIKLYGVIGMDIRRCTAKNARGTSGASPDSTHQEKWNWHIQQCANGFLYDCVATADNPASYGSTGMNPLYSENMRITRCTSHHNKFHGMNAHSCSNILYTDCWSYSNLTHGGLNELCRDVHYENCVFGGQANFRNAGLQSGETTNASYGNTQLGMNVQGGQNVTFSNTDFIANGTTGLQTQPTVDASEGPGLVYGVRASNCTFRGNGSNNVACLTASSVNGGRNAKFSNCHFSGAGNHDVYLGAFGTGYDFARPTGGFIAASCTPAVAASGGNVTNEHPFTVAVHVAGGTGVNVTVDGSQTGSATIGFVEPGGTIGLGAYTGTPSWKWVTA